MRVQVQHALNVVLASEMTSSRGEREVVWSDVVVGRSVESLETEREGGSVEHGCSRW